MSEYTPRPPRAEPLDLTNEDVVQQILESGTPEEIEALRTAGNLDQKTIELYRYFAQLRRSVIEIRYQEIAKRKTDAPVADEEELSAGIYREGIEPQVRDTVFRLRTKGCRTLSSGFGKENVQKISLDTPQFDRLILPKEMREELDRRGVTVTVTPKEIKLSFSVRATLEEIKNVWELIEGAIPDLKVRAPQATTGEAVSFRKKQAKLKPTREES